MRKVSGTLTFLALLVVFITLGAEPSFAEKESVVPDKSFKEMKVKSVKKKLKDKAFCRAVNRDEVRQGAAELEWELEEMIEFLIKAMHESEEEFGLGAAFGK